MLTPLQRKGMSKSKSQYLEKEATVAKAERAELGRPISVCRSLLLQREPGPAVILLSGIGPARSAHCRFRHAMLPIVRGLKSASEAHTVFPGRVDFFDPSPGGNHREHRQAARAAFTGPCILALYSEPRLSSDGRLRRWD